MVTYDKLVRAGDARPAGAPDECFYCRSKMGAEHKDDCIIIDGRILDAMPSGVWQPIETYRDGWFVLFWFPYGERGIGGIQAAMAYRDDDDVIRSGWSHGGPNSGWDFEFCEPPTMWAKPPDRPAGWVQPSEPRPLWDETANSPTSNG